MQIIQFAALAAASQAFVASAAWLPRRDGSALTTPYLLPNQTVFGSSGMLYPTGATGATGRLRPTGVSSSSSTSAPTSAPYPMANQTSSLPAGSGTISGTGVGTNQNSTSAQTSAPYPLTNQTSSLPAGSGTITGTGALQGTGVPKKQNATSTTSSPASSTSSSDDDGDSPFLPDPNQTPSSTNSTSSNTTSTNTTQPTTKPTYAPNKANAFGLSAPVFNLNNNSCADLSALNASGQWAAVDGDEVVSKFEQAWNQNLLICDDCFGQTKDKCKSSNVTCQQGLNDLSKLPGSNDSRWDTAAARFAQDPDITDLQCRIQQGECSAAPNCASCNGPGTFVILKSLETLNNALNNQYNAIIEAGHEATNQQTAFSNTFAPVPSIKDQALTEGLIFTILGGILGFAGIFGGIAALGVGIFGEISQNNLFFGQQGPADTSSVLGVIANSTAQQYVEISDSLFATGEYQYSNADGTKGKTVKLSDMMSQGQLLQSDNDGNDTYTALVPVYARIMYQQLAYYTWQNMEKDKMVHTPFIAFTSGACKDVSDKTPGFDKDGILAPVLNVKNANIDYKGNCYWLLDGTQVEHTEINYSGFGGNYISYSCGIKGSLPGGTSDTLNDMKNVFAGLSLEDFIIPSVEGWLANNKNDDYTAAGQDGKLYDDPRAPGALNIPVCDYVGNKNVPGVRCPQLGGDVTKDKGCNLVPRSAIGNAPGTFAPGNCGVHVRQYQKNEGNENNFNQYQLEITIKDGAGREVGDGAKELAAVPLAVGGSLPYQLIVGAGKTDSDPIEFWYADDYWNSNDQSHGCSVGKYDSGHRDMDCGFACPLEDPTFGDSHSATIGHTLFAKPTEAIVADATFVNTFDTPAPTGTPAPPPPPPANVASGGCSLHVRQYQKNENKDNENPTPNYKLEVTVYGNDHALVGQSGEVEAPAHQAVTIMGLIAPLTVATENVDSDGLDFTLKSLKWNSATDNKKQPGGVSCSVGKYDSGHRDMDCGFPCAP